MKIHLLFFLLIPGIFLSFTQAAQDVPRNSARGPLRVCAANSRYFATPDGRPVYLTGSHTWQSLQDGVLSNYTTVRQPFDYTGYLNLLQTSHHNFIRLWRWELTTHQPQPWLRTGPSQALDGKPKFDLRQFNQPYFDRLRSRVIAARDRGIYVSIMLFEDWIFMNKRDDYPVAQHPFHKDNNVSGINGDPNGDGWGVEIHALQVPEILEIQKGVATFWQRVGATLLIDKGASDLARHDTASTPRSAPTSRWRVTATPPRPSAKSNAFPIAPSCP